MLEQFNLAGRVAVVTGGTGALGSEMCRGLAAAGAKVVILARTTEKTTALADAIKADGGEAIGIGVDVLDKIALEGAARQIDEAYGAVDILVNGAGGNQPGATATPGKNTFFDLPQDAMEWVFDLNLMGTILPSQVFGAAMAERKQGVIINVSSMASYQAITRVVGYSAAKAAINNFTQWMAVSMAKEYGEGFRVNAIAPGFFIGEQNRFLLFDKDTGELSARGQTIIDNTPMGRFGELDEVVGTLVWLCSDAAKFVTGIVVPIDGGFSAFSGV